MLRKATEASGRPKRIAGNSSAMGLAMKPDHELVTKNLSAPLKGTQLYTAIA